MDSAQTRLLAVLLLGAAAIGGVLWFQGRPTDPTDADATAEVWEVDADDVVSVRIERAEGGNLAFERQGEDWVVTEPGPARADQRRLLELLDGLAALEHAIPVAVPGGDGAPFGLGSPPEARVAWTNAAGQTHMLELGIRAPAAYRVYVRTADGSVGAASGDPTRLLTAPAATFRDQRLFTFEPGEVRGVRIEADGHALDVRGSGRSWQLEGYGRAEADQVDDLVTDLAALRFDEEVAGLRPEVADVLVTVSLADGSVEIARLGAGDGSGLPTEAPDGRTGRVFEAARGMLGRGPTDVGQQTAFQIRPQVATQVVVERGGARFEATRDGETWTAAGGGAGYDVVTAFASVPVERTLEPALPPPQPPEARVIVTEPPVQDGGAPLVVTFAVGPDVDGVRTVRDEAGPGPGVKIPSAAWDAAVSRLP